VAAHRTVYCTSPDDTALVAIDCSADTVLAVIPVSEYAGAVCYNPANDRVYCASWDEGIYGIDAATNRVVSVIPYGYAGMMACDPVRNVLFVPDGEVLLVVDCSADTVFAQVELDEEDAWLAGYSASDNKIYVVEEGGG